MSRLVRNRFPCSIRRYLVVLSDAKEWFAGSSVYISLRCVDLERYFGVTDEFFRVIVVACVFLSDIRSVYGYSERFFLVIYVPFSARVVR